MVYGIFTAGQRTWGGPRADAGRADEKTTPGQAIENAAAQGDELNVVPETFKPALEAATHRMPHQAPLLPSGHLDGRFTPAIEIAGGWYRQISDSGRLHSDMTPRLAEGGFTYSKERRSDSMDSFYSADSPTNSAYIPRRVESIVGLEDALTYHDRQARQKPAGGAYFETPTIAGAIPAFSNGPIAAKTEYSNSVRSFESDSSVPLHFDVPVRGRTMDFGGPGATASQPVRQPVGQTHAASQRERHEQTPPVLTIPVTAYHPTNRAMGSSNRTGRSPLARRSFTRVAADYTGSTGGELVETPDRVPRRHSVAGDGRRGRRSVSIDRHGRRRLSKQRTQGRSASQE